MVPVNDLSRRGSRFATAFGAAAERVARSGSYLLGPELEAFEREFSAYLGCSNVVGVASGATALQVGLAALGVGAGDEVIVPGFTAVPTAAAVVAVGATPILVDVDPHTACLESASAQAAVTSRTKAAIVVHLYGYPAEPPELGVPVIEDAAQAHGALIDPGRSAMTAYSFYPTKNLGGIGDGGAVVTEDAALADEVRLLRVHGMTAQYVHERISQNFRMSELEAAWLRLVLLELDSDLSHRRAIAGRYRRAAPHLSWQQSHPRHAYHLCVFRSLDRDATRAELDRAGVATAVHYPLAISRQPAYRHLVGVVPEAERWAAECISLPCFPEMTEHEIDQVCVALSRLPE